MSEPESMRLDKWLWATRFFKTRQLAVAAISGGRVHLNGQRTKPGKAVCAGSRLRIHKGSLEWTVTVDQIPKQRRPAAEAAGCYQEDESSVRKREELMAQARLLRAAAPQPAAGKPSKRDRRMIHRFTGK